MWRDPTSESKLTRMGSNQRDAISTKLQPSHFLFYFLLLLLLTASDAFYMDGTADSYVQYPRWRVCFISDVGFEFKSDNPDGLLFYTDDPGQNFFALLLENQKLTLRFRLNSQRLEEVIASDNMDLSDNKWHKVMMELNPKRSYLSVDNHFYSFAIGSSVPSADFQFVFLGGVANTGTNQYRVSHNANPSTRDPPPKFKGQMQNLQYSNCLCPLRSAAIVKMREARSDNLCETNNPCNQNCDCLIDESGTPQCNCVDKQCPQVVRIQDVDVSITLTTTIHTVNDRFVSVALGASMIDTPNPLEIVLRSKKLIALARALAPAYLRLGGTAADFVTFEQEACRGTAGTDPNCIYCGSGVIFNLEPTLFGVSKSASLQWISSGIIYEFNNPCRGLQNSKVIRQTTSRTTSTIIGEYPQLVRVDTTDSGFVVGGIGSSANTEYALSMRGQEDTWTLITLACDKSRNEEPMFEFLQENPPKTYRFILRHAAACPRKIEAGWEVKCPPKDNVQYDGFTYRNVTTTANWEACKQMCINESPKCAGFTFRKDLTHCLLKTKMARPTPNTSAKSGICKAKKKGNRKGPGKKEPRTMTGRDWEEINEFAMKTGLRLLFDVNGLKTKASGDWDSSNAATLLRYSAARNYSFDLQLGNEPNSYKHQVGREVSAEQLAQNYKELRRLLQSGIGGDGMKKALVVGPELTRPKGERERKYLSNFLKDAINEIDAISWHQYYLHGDTRTLENFTNTTVFTYLREQIARILNIRHVNAVNTLGVLAALKDLFPMKPIWITETAAAAGGGVSGLSDRFVDGFLWLDKLGMAASKGIDVVVRQTLSRGQYGLLEGQKGYFDPRPSYWLTLLFKRLVGRRVLEVLHDVNEEEFGGNGGLRLYAHCAADNAAQETSAVTLFGLNVKAESFILRLKAEAAGVRMNAEAAGKRTKAEAAGKRMKSEAVEESSPWKVIVRNYILQSDDATLDSKKVRLNGKTIIMDDVLYDQLPVLKPVVEKFKEAGQVRLKMPGFGLAFYVIEGLDATACQD